MLEMEGQFMMRKLYEEGLTISEISRETGHCRKTVRKYIREKEYQSFERKSKRKSKLDPYKDSKIRIWLDFPWIFFQQFFRQIFFQLSSRRSIINIFHIRGITAYGKEYILLK